MAKHKTGSGSKWRRLFLLLFILAGMLLVWHYMEGNHPQVSSFKTPDIPISSVPLQ